MLSQVWDLYKQRKSVIVQARLSREARVSVLQPWYDDAVDVSDAQGAARLLAQIQQDR